MIKAISARSAGIISRLAERAERLAVARAQNKRLAHSFHPQRWRRAALLWPNFTGES